MKQERKIGRDLVKSLIAVSIDAQTIEPIISAKTYKALKNVYAAKTNKTIKTNETIRD